MKKLYNIIAIAIVAMTVTACGSKVKYNISGNWENGKGETVTLKEVVASGNDAQPTVYAETVVAEDGSFAFTGKADAIGRVAFAAAGKEKKLFIDGEPIVLSIKETTRTNRKGEEITSTQIAIVSGSPEQEVLKLCDDTALGYSLLKLGGMVALSKVKDEPEEVFDSVYMATQKLEDAIKEKTLHYADSLKSCYAITYLIGDFILKNYDIDDAVKAYEGLDENVKKSAPGRDLDSRIQDMLSVNVGGMAPNFTLPTPDDKKLSLYDLRGNIVLLDFWASWCSPCLAEMPNVKAIYEKHHADGLEILGVSLDKDGDKWRNAIETKELNWHHVSSLNEWSCPVARRYNVTGIPRMYIIDRDGKIIAQDLRGEELAKKMDELFAK